MKKVRRNKKNQGKTNCKKVPTSIRCGRAVRKLVRRAKRIGLLENNKQAAAYTFFGAGIGFLGAGQIVLGSTSIVLAGMTEVSFNKLSMREKKKLTSALIGRPKLAEAVCGKINAPELEMRLKHLGKIYLPNAELKNLRKHVLGMKKFDLPFLLSEIKLLQELGEANERSPRLTYRTVQYCLDIYKTKLEWPLSRKTQRALTFARDLIDLIHDRKLEYRTIDSIISQVFDFEVPVPQTSKEKAVLHLGRRVNLYMSDSVESFDSDVFARFGYKTRVEKVMETVGGKLVWGKRVKLIFTPIKSPGQEKKL